LWRTLGARITFNETLYPNYAKGLEAKGPMNYRGTIAYRAGLGGNVPEGFTASLVSAWDFLLRTYHVKCPSENGGEICTCEEKEPVNIHFMRGLSCMLHDSANQIAEGFLGDWVLFLDTDHVFKSDALFEMVQTFEDNKLDILSGFAQKRQPPYLPLIMKTNFNPLIPFEPIIPDPITKNLLIPIDAAGLACTMVSRRVFDRIEKMLNERPFDFRLKFDPRKVAGYPKDVPIGVWDGFQNRHIPDNYQMPPDRRFDEFYWEDISFFWRAALLGFKSYCAPWIKFHHIETRIVTDDMMMIDKNPIPQ